MPNTRKEEVDGAIAVLIASGEPWADNVAQVLHRLYVEQVRLLSILQERELQHEATVRGTGLPAAQRTDVGNAGDAVHLQ